MRKRITVSMALLLLTVTGFITTAFAYETGRDHSGAVYAMTNASNNEIIVYERAANGMLTQMAAVPTEGSGGILVPEDALGAQGPLLLSPDQHWLFAVNAGSNEISVFRVDKNGISLTDNVASNGMFPVSLTLHENLLYVLNSGGDGNITGFTLDSNGQLTPLDGSTRSLNAGGKNPPFFLVSPAQVGFNPRGDQLVVTVKGSNKIHVFAVDANGLPSAEPVDTMSNGSTPFGFAFDELGHLLVVEAFGRNDVGTAEAGAVSSYSLEEDGVLSVISPSVENHQTATCWIAISPIGRYAYTTNNGSNTIAGYRINPRGGLVLLDPPSGVTAMTGTAPVDLAMTPDGRFLYNVNALDGTLSMYRANRLTGTLIPLGTVDGLPMNGGAVGIAAR